MKTKTKLSFQKLLDKTGRMQYTNKDVVPSAEPCEPQELEFFTIGKSVSDEELEKEAAQRGLELAPPYALALYAKEHPEFADEKSVGTHFKDKSGNWCFATFDGWGGGRDVGVDRRSGEWSDDWSFAGLRKVGTQTSETLASESLRPLSLDSAIKICKDNGLVIYKPL